MTHAYALTKRRPEAHFGRFTHLQRRGSKLLSGPDFTHLMMTFKGSRTDLNSLLRIQVECSATRKLDSKWRCVTAFAASSALKVRRVSTHYTRLSDYFNLQKNLLM